MKYSFIRDSLELKASVLIYESFLLEILEFSFIMEEYISTRGGGFDEA